MHQQNIKFKFVKHLFTNYMVGVFWNTYQKCFNHQKHFKSWRNIHWVPILTVYSILSEEFVRLDSTMAWEYGSKSRGQLFDVRCSVDLDDRIRWTSSVWILYIYVINKVHFQASFISRISHKYAGSILLE